ncbi:isopenicillin N synthase family dioxygenase [Tropicimonas sediminicola]|uniref:2-oxoglutarate-dependent ethylene/succinate-forming enzyme n=1 Tax=Tropicimonas sediminicola TaxID=1031541 RepID=A0A239ID49_9RHOB|nr:2OG-Fe(II) oxygenase family protein [Tropicimonas sediminicola]SNS91477.1 Isopenicillin N synthase [Tropicimonas sediminicola]
MIPTLDWRRFSTGSDRSGFIADLGAACKAPGFFLLTGHRIDPALVSAVFSAADGLFDLTEAEKRTLALPSRPKDRGWSKIGTESSTADSPHPDRRETFGIGPETLGNAPQMRWGTPYRGTNVWPDMPGFRDVMLKYFGAAQALSLALHWAIAADLGFPEGWFDARFRKPDASLRLMHYPPARGLEGEMGAGAHVDQDALTLLLTDDEPGLQVWSAEANDWIDVPHVPGAIVVNVGTCLQDWSGGRYAAPLHRVLPPREDRRSVAFFLRPEKRAPQVHQSERSSLQAWAPEATGRHANA